MTPGRPRPPGHRTSVRERLIGLLVALLGAVGIGLLGIAAATPASAVDDSTTTISGTLRAGNEPVPNASITVTGGGGAPLTVQSGPDGRFVATVPTGGSYEVRLDPASLPAGVTLNEGAQNPRTVLVATGQTRAAPFGLTKEGFVANRVTTIESLQLLLDGIKFGLIIAITAIGLSLVFGTTGLTNFAHGEYVTFGALAAWFFNVKLGVPFLLAGVLAMIAGGAASGLLDLGLWRPLRRRGTGLIAALVVSIGLSLFLRYLYLFFYGGGSRPYDQYAIQSPIDLGIITVLKKDIVADLVVIVVLVAVGLALQKSRLGTAIRAVSDNRDLAAASGIAVERVVSVVWVAGGALAALGGVILGLTQQVRFDMGFTLLLLIFAGVTLGGLGTAYGALLGGLLVGILTSMSTLVIPAELRNVGALAVLVLVLLVKPTGLLGRRERIG